MVGRTLTADQKHLVAHSARSLLPYKRSSASGTSVGTFWKLAATFPLRVRAWGRAAACYGQLGTGS